MENDFMSTVVNMLTIGLGVICIVVIMSMIASLVVQQHDSNMIELRKVELGCSAYTPEKR